MLQSINSRHKAMRNIRFLIMMSMFINTSFASNAGFDSALALAKSEGKGKSENSIKLVKQFEPKNVFSHYTNNPEQASYYGGITQSDTKQMENRATEQKSSGLGQDIQNSINQHSRYVIKPTDPDMKHSQLIQEEADSIIRGITSKYIDCKPKQACTTQYLYKQCNEAPQAIFQSCHKKLNIDVVSHETVTHYPLNAYLTVEDHNYAGISLNVVDGKVDFLGPHDARFRLEGRLPKDIDCHTLQGSVISNTGGAKLDSINFPSCANGLSLNYHISGGHRKDLKIDIISKVMTYDVKDNWLDTCHGLSSDKTCKLRSNICDIPKSTQVIHGVPVTRDCWQESYQYICRGGSGAGNCVEYRSHGCEQIGSACKEKTNDQCMQYTQTYRCPVSSCSPTTDIVCGDGEVYCLDGSCTDHTYKESQDFAKGVSALSTVADAGKQLDQSSLAIFTGHPVECSEKPMGYSNCCTESGWGQDVGLDHCPESAKKLHTSRENKLAIKVGRYCSGPDLFPCIEHSQVFCVFSSKLAKIIQEQGRKGQLHINFGSAKEPSCSGISSEQLQSINLSKIDFRDFISDLNNSVKNHDLKLIQEMIQKHVKEAQSTGHMND